MSEHYIPDNLKVAIRDNARLVCEYCLALSTFAFHSFAIDHIIPISLGGLTIFENLAFSCQHCNNAKYNKIESLDPLENCIAPLFHPRKDIWADHFLWNEGNTIIIGKSPSGSQKFAKSVN